VPWALLIRMFARIAAGLFLWRVATARRGAYRTAPNGAPVGAPPPPARLRGRGAAAAIREGAVLGWRAVSLVAFIVAAVVLVTAGSTLTVLTPRWLGGVLLGLAVVSIVAAFLEARVVYRLLAVRRQRRRQERLVSGL
jgi:hypothetical protein